MWNYGSPTTRRWRRLLAVVPQRGDDPLVLRVPGDGGVRHLRSLLERLDAGRVEVDGLAVRTPDLDDVFFATTGQNR
jgi:ABC-2 type transport system ATP-binding protein